MTDAAIVQTDSGPVRGSVTGDYRLFQGVPYAASTAAERRWRSPQPVPRWTQPKDATKPGSMCPQQASSYADVASLEEGCLYLNVTTPHRPAHCGAGRCWYGSTVTAPSGPAASSTPADWPPSGT